MEANWISVEDKMPDCYSQHNKDYGSGYVLGYTRFGEIEITQLWNNEKWETDAFERLDYITHWMPLPPLPKKQL